MRQTLGGRTVLDFSSALYLGLRHGSNELGPWTQLSTGRPPALEEIDGGAAVAASLSSLMGVEQALLAPSTLHLAFDLFTMLASHDATIFLDEEAYPIVPMVLSHSGASRRVRVAPHFDPGAMRRLVERTQTRCPIVVTDGYCPACGRIAPVDSLAQTALSHGGVVVIDDTQALGIFGRRMVRAREPGVAAYGSGGGGTLRTKGLGTLLNVIVIASLAKAFGAPIAVLGGPREIVDAVRQQSFTRVHCSGPSAADVNAAANALAINAGDGDRIRERLAANVSRFKERLALAGIHTSGGLFPVQIIGRVPHVGTRELFATVSRMGVGAPLLSSRQQQPRIGFLLNARHTDAEIDRAVDALIAAANGPASHKPSEVHHGAGNGQRSLAGVAAR